MQTIRQILQNILLYVMMMAVLKSLVTKEGFLEIFRFVSGVILILVCAGSFVSLATNDDGWYEILEEKLFENDMEQLQEEINLSQENLEEVLVSEWKKDFEEQVRKIVQAQGEEIEDIQVETEKNTEGEFAVKSISLELGEGEETQKKYDKITKKLKKKICNKFDLSGKVVKVWRKNG
jgi:putative lipoic acid-binding regulatory protein